MKVRNLFAVLTLAVAMFLSLSVGAQTNPPRAGAAARTENHGNTMRRHHRRRHHRRHRAVTNHVKK